MSSFGINEKEVSDKLCTSSRKVIIKKRPDIDITDDNSSDLGKRKLADSFGLQIYNDKDRYGQDIPPDFFETNIGHDVYEDSHIDEAEILEWCYKYLASKKK
jgi:hypothetical protein